MRFETANAAAIALPEQDRIRVELVLECGELGDTTSPSRAAVRQRCFQRPSQLALQREARGGHIFERRIEAG